MASPFDLKGQLISGGIQLAADKLLGQGRFQKVNPIEKFIPGGGITGQGTGDSEDDKTKGPTTLGGIAKTGIMSILAQTIAKSLLGPVLGPIALAVGQKVVDNRRAQGLGFLPFGGDEDDGPIGPGGINLVELEKGIQSAEDDTDPADYGLVDAATADIQDYADIMPEDSGSSNGGGGGSTGTMDASDFSDDSPGTPFRYGGIASLYR